MAIIEAMGIFFTFDAMYLYDYYPKIIEDLTMSSFGVEETNATWS